MDKEQRYEVNRQGELVVGIPNVCTDRKLMLEKLFNRYGWTYEILSEITKAHYYVKVSNTNLDKSFTFHLFHGNVRKEDPDRNRAEKKIQLGGLDPREFSNEMCLILGVYIYDSEAIDDAVIVAWPVEQEKNYPNNPSLRVNMKQDIIPAKNGGIYFDRTTGKTIVVFQPSFIYYYLEHYQELHRRGEPAVDVCEEATPEWFAKEAVLLEKIDDEAEELYKDFRERFSPDILSSLSGLDLLHKMFINETGSKDSLCHILDFDRRYFLFGSISGGFAYKYGLFYSAKDKAWITGAGKHKKFLTEDEAIALGTTIRDELVLGGNIIKSYGEITSLNDYSELHAKLFPKMPHTIGKSWVMKYFHMIFPDIFPVFYSEDWQKNVLEKISIEPDENSFIRMGQIALFAKQCGITNVAFSKVVWNLPGSSEIHEDALLQKSNYEYETTYAGGHNRVVYGTPGCGKSYYVEKVLLPQIGVDTKNNMIRTTFYQDYTNTDFVGQILPKVLPDKSVSYEFNPGPFTLALKKAIEQPNTPVALVIEELNRGNAASIFGDIFQLLDRDETGKSEYEITNVNVQDYLNKCFVDQKIVFESIRIPSNLYIVATMNTSDQNVFTLDTAFKRRWLFEKIRNKFDNTHLYKGYYIPGMDGVTWEELVNGINKFILDHPDDLSSEDKLIGIYFIEKDTLCDKVDDCNNAEKKKRFAYKLFEYLWDDVAKFAHTDWFGPEIKSLDQLIDEYMESGKQVLAYVLK